MSNLGLYAACVATAAASGAALWRCEQLVHDAGAKTRRDDAAIKNEFARLSTQMTLCETDQSELRRGMSGMQLCSVENYRDHVQEIVNVIEDGMGSDLIQLRNDLETMKQNYEIDRDRRALLERPVAAISIRGGSKINSIRDGSKPR